MNPTPATVKFNQTDRPEFFRVLRRRVKAHFEETNQSRYANGRMVFKTIFMITLYTLPLGIILSGAVTTFWVAALLWVAMGFGMAGIGLSIMHDANHGAYSRNPRVNQALGAILNLVGGYHVNWKIQHNVLHHSYTNVHDFDEDIKKGIIRFSPNQPAHRGYYYQAFYAPFLYGLMTLVWVFLKDFVQTIDYNKRGLLKTQGLTFRRAMATVLFNKSWYLAITLVLPIIILPFAWWQTLLCFLGMHFICGLILALVFQPAHVIEETQFFKAADDGSVENSWAIHQLLTTANFANGNRPLSWFVGGLNYQIEHHLFPNICHVHYRDISKIIKATALEYGLPYHEHPTFTAAIRSHFSLLHKLGTGQYDKQYAKAS
jgi:linoleoyl-CoA desaturase